VDVVNVHQTLEIEKEEGIVGACLRCGGRPTCRAGSSVVWNGNQRTRNPSQGDEGRCDLNCGSTAGWQTLNCESIPMRCARAGNKL